MENKFCIRCKETKPTSEFHKNKRGADGLSNYCRSCKKLFYKEDYAKHSDTYKERAKAGKIGREQEEKERLKEWYRNHTELAKQRARDAYAANPERAKERIAKWNLAHKEWVAIRSKKSNKIYRTRERLIVFAQNRRSKKRSVRSDLTINQWRWLLELSNYRCLCCGKAEVTLDHIIALNPGEHTLSNIQPLCFNCNRRKRRKTIDFRPQWLIEMVKEVATQQIYNAKITLHTASRLLPSTRERLTF